MAGRYRLLFRIARGGMGSVFAAILEGQRGVDRTVAIKLLNSQEQTPEEIDAFVQEAKLTARITHPNLLDTFELGMEEGEPFLVMPLVRGVSLSHLLKRGEPLDPDLAAWIAMQVAAGLHAAHELKGEDGALLGVIHRDVSPQNVLLSYEGRVLLLDFGVAKLFESSRATASGVIKGKFGYMSPEQLMGEPLDRRTDVFALGVVLYEMLVGRPLYAQLPPAQATLRIASSEIPRARDVLDSVPEALDDVIARCMARTKEGRFATALEVRDALRSVLRARGASVDESDLAALLGRCFAEERESFEERLRSALAGRASPEAPSTIREVRDAAAADERESPQLQSNASKVVMTSETRVPSKRDRGFWPIGLVAAGVGAVAALVMGLRTNEPPERAPPASLAATTATTAATTAAEPTMTAPSSTAPTDLPPPASASASAADAAPPSAAPATPPAAKATKGKPSAQPSAPPSPPPATTNPRGEPFRDF
jgi:serine/threonine-protein kinase